VAAHQAQGNQLRLVARGRGGGPRIAERSGVAYDSYHRDPEDIRLLVDRDTFVRSPGPSLHWFGNVAKAFALAGVPPQATASDAPSRQSPRRSNS
jgi:hypothetical protein